MTQLILTWPPTIPLAISSKPWQKILESKRFRLDWWLDSSGWQGMVHLNLVEQYCQKCSSTTHRVLANMSPFRFDWFVHPREREKPQVRIPFDLHAAQTTNLCKKMKSNSSFVSRSTYRSYVSAALEHGHSSWETFRSSLCQRNRLCIDTSAVWWAN